LACWPKDVPTGGKLRSSSDGQAGIITNFGEKSREYQ
jgi:hypothetical protein